MVMDIAHVRSPRRTVNTPAVVVGMYFLYTSVDTLEAHSLHSQMRLVC